MKIKLVTAACLILVSRQTLFANQAEQKFKTQSNVLSNITVPAEFYRPFIQKNIESEQKQLQQEATTKVLPQRALLMFIDEQEKDIYEGEPIVWSFFSALEQKVAPILVSQSCLELFRKGCNEIDKRMKNSDPSLLSNLWIRYQQQIFASKQNEVDTVKADAKITEWIQKEAMAETARHASGHLIMEALLAYRSFNPAEWLVFKVASAYLLVPHDLLHAIDNTYNAETYRRGGYTKNQLSQFSFALGLAIASLEKAPDDWFTGTNSSWLKRASQYLSSWMPTTGKLAGSEIIDNLGNIFTSRSAHRAASSNPPIPEWTIYLEGHGLIGLQVAGIHISLFPLMLNFCEDKIITKLLLYDSCYAAGLNAQVIYKNLDVVYEHKGIKQTPSYKTYAYPIISAAIGDFPTYRVHPMFKGTYDDSGKLQVIHYKNFAEFIVHAFSPQKQGQYRHIIEPILQAIGQKDPLHVQVSKKLFESKQLTSINAAQILLPGLSWFSVVGLQDNVISIGQILAATRDIQKPLNVSEFFKQQSHPDSTLKGLLLYTHEVPFALDMSTLQEPMPRIISMVPGETSHLLTNLIAPQYGFPDIAKSFVSPKEIQKWLIADTMTVKNDMPIIGDNTPKDVLTISEVLITSQFGYFTYENESYKFIRASGEIQEITLGEDQDNHKKIFQEEKAAVVSKKTNATPGLISLSPEQLSHIAEKLRAMHKKQANIKQQAEQK